MYLRLFLGELLLEPATWFSGGWKGGIVKTDYLVATRVVSFDASLLTVRITPEPILHRIVDRLQR